MSLKKQSSQLQQMTRHVNFCKDIPNDTSLSALQLRLSQIKKINKDFENNQMELEEQCGKDTIEEQFNIRAQFEEYYYMCHVNIQDTIDETNDVKERDNTLNGNGNAPRQQEVKLPRIELTPFSGRYEDWSSFRDLFSSLIHTNATISNVQKLHYLKSNVQGDADRLLKSITITEDNYAEAWKKLTDRYDHRRYIVDCSLKSFLNQPKVLSENSESIKNLIDKSSEIIQGLKLQGIPVAHWDAIVVHIIVSKLDSETHRQWELKQTKDALPIFNDLQEFLEARWQSLEMIQQSTSKHQSFSDRRQGFNNNNGTHTASSNRSTYQSSSKCLNCSESDHKLYKCSKYNSFNVEEKRNFLKVNRLCFNCLSSGHSAAECSNLARCKHCKRNHHSSIHKDSRNSSSYHSQLNTTALKENIVHSATASNTSKKRVLLATAVVYIHSSNGERFPVKALIDKGSENATITEALAKKLRLNQTPDETIMFGIGDTEITTKKTAVTFQISSSVDPTFYCNVEATVMKKIAGDVPMVPVHRESWPHLQGIKLADPHFDRPSPIEILLGAEVYEQIILDGLIQKKEHSPTAQNSRLGWLLYGVVKSDSDVKQIPISKCLLSTKADSLDKTLRSFWEMEEIPEKRKLNVKEQQAENIFVENVHQDKEGRYVVALPFDPDKEALEIGESKKAALHGLFRMESRFKNNREFVQSHFEMNRLF